MFFSASIVRRRPLWHAGAPGPGRGSKRFVGKAFPLELAQFSKGRLSFGETVAGHFGRAVKRSTRNVGATESVARAGVVERTVRLYYLGSLSGAYQPSHRQSAVPLGKIELFRKKCKPCISPHARGLIFRASNIRGYRVFEILRFFFLQPR